MVPIPPSINRLFEALQQYSSLNFTIVLKFVNGYVSILIFVIIIFLSHSFNNIFRCWPLKYVWPEKIP